MSMELTILAIALALIVVLPLLIFTVEVTAGLRRMPPGTLVGTLPRTVVLIPAHDEESGIAATIAALSSPRAAGVDILVVADNCRDGTAAVARAAGCQVVERHDPTRRGKGYALAAGRDALALDPPACVIVLDADCTVDGDGIERLAQRCVAYDRAVQSSYLFRPTPSVRPGAVVSNIAFLVKNLVRQQGMSRVGRVAVLTGTGMAFPWADFHDASLATSELVEDLALGIELTRRGRPPRFDPTVQTWSDPASGGDMLIQRQRWEYGFVNVARRKALPLLLDGIGHGSRSATWLGLHLLVPPLALLALMLAASTLLTLALAIAGGSWWIPIGLIGISAVAAIALLAALARYGGEQVRLDTLLAVPSYILSKLSIYRALAGRGPTHWQRTRRAGEEERPEL